MARLDDISLSQGSGPLFSGECIILATVLALRLGKVVGKVVGPNQHAFFNG